MKRKRSLVFLLITAALLSLLAVFLHFTSDDDPGVSPVLPPSFTPVLGAVVEGAEVPATEAPKSTRSPVDGELPDNAQPVSDADRMAIAVKFVGRPVEELTAALGGPARVSYTPSASAAGEDGVLEYSGFTVNTYREGTEEIVQSVQGS